MAAVMGKAARRSTQAAQDCDAMRWRIWKRRGSERTRLMARICRGAIAARLVDFESVATVRYCNGCRLRFEESSIAGGNLGDVVDYQNLGGALLRFQLES